MASAIWGYMVGPDKDSGRRTYEFAITIVSPLREFANQIRGVGFLLDEEKLRKDNTIFVPLVPLTRRQIHELKERGLVVSSDSISTSYDTCRTVQKKGVLVLVLLMFTPLWIGSVAAYLVRDYWIWRGFLRRYAVKKVISHADFGFRHISRNIILKSSGVETWYYVDTENFGGLNFNPGANPRRHMYWTYLYYDKCVAWSERVIDYYRMHRQAIDQYFAVGCLWSENARDLRESKSTSQLRAYIRSRGLCEKTKILAVFDSTYNNFSRTTYEDGIGFAEGIDKLLEELEDVFVVWKEKKPRWIHKEKGSSELIAIYNRMAKHARCYFAGSDTAVEEVLALCDMAISFPFTSTTIEALGAGIKGIYYSPNGKFKGSYFEAIPGLVAHDYAGLREVAEKLLYRWNEYEYKKYVDEHVKGKIDPYLDGKGITRFRELLCAGS